MRKAFAILILFTNCAAAQMVEGNIVNSVTSASIPRVAVHLEVASGSDSEDQPYDTVTDALGHFVFAQIKPALTSSPGFHPHMSRLKRRLFRRSM